MQPGAGGRPDRDPRLALVGRGRRADPHRGRPRPRQAALAVLADHRHGRGRRAGVDEPGMGVGEGHGGRPLDTPGLAHGGRRRGAARRGRRARGARTGRADARGRHRGGRRGGGPPGPGGSGGPPPPGGPGGPARPPGPDRAPAARAGGGGAPPPARLPLIAPVATWAGVTRDDEPGCDDAADHRGTVLRMVARDTEVAARIARWVRGEGRRALVVAGAHEYGVQLDGQLRMAGLPRAEASSEADLVVLCGLAGSPEIERATELAPLPVVAFDGVQGAGLGAGRDVRLALPAAPAPGVVVGDVLFFVEPTRRAAELVVAALRTGAADRAAVLAEMRRLGPFDDHGDPVDPPVWLWRAGDDWSLEPDRAI